MMNLEDEVLEPGKGLTPAKQLGWKMKDQEDKQISVECAKRLGLVYPDTLGGPIFCEAKDYEQRKRDFKCDCDECTENRN